jgi:hypothetical protein
MKMRNAMWNDGLLNRFIGIAGSYPWLLYGLCFIFYLLVVQGYRIVSSVPFYTVLKPVTGARLFFQAVRERVSLPAMHLYIQSI